MKSLRFLLPPLVFIIVITGLFWLRQPLVYLYQDLKSSFNSFFDRAFDYRELLVLQQENKVLKLELSRISDSIARPNSIEASVYSRYPFNDKDRLIIDKGLEYGIIEQSPVFTTDNFLLGRIVSVGKFKSEVQTIFDPEWKNSVAIGQSEARSVLTGGHNPKLSFIEIDAVIESGDIVFNIDPDIPLGTPIGEIDSLSLSSDDIWQEGHVITNYNVWDLRKVLVLNNFLD